MPRYRLGLVSPAYATMCCHQEKFPMSPPLRNPKLSLASCPARSPPFILHSLSSSSVFLLGRNRKKKEIMAEMSSDAFEGSLFEGSSRRRRWPPPFFHGADGMLAKIYWANPRRRAASQNDLQPPLPAGLQSINIYI